MTSDTLRVSLTEYTPRGGGRCATVRVFLERTAEAWAPRYRFSMDAGQNREAYGFGYRTAHEAESAGLSAAVEACGL